MLLGADSNCSEKSTNRRNQAFHSFCVEHNLIQIRSHGPTFHHCNGVSSSNIDLFLISHKHASHLTQIALECSEENPENFSSHDPVFAKLILPSSGKTSKQDRFIQTYTPFRPTKILWDKTNLENYQKIAEEALQKYENIFNSPEYIPLKCQLYSDLLVKSAELCFTSNNTQP